MGSNCILYRGTILRADHVAVIHRVIGAVIHELSTQDGAGHELARWTRVLLQNLLRQPQEEENALKYIELVTQALSKEQGEPGVQRAGQSDAIWIMSEAWNRGLDYLRTPDRLDTERGKAWCDAAIRLGSCLPNGSPTKVCLLAPVKRGMRQAVDEERGRQR